MHKQLRAWQRHALQEYQTADQRDFLAAVTPGGGKTVFALSVARRLLDEGVVDRVAVVVPSDALRSQWVHAATEFAIDLKSVHQPEDYDRPGFAGYVTTYQGIGTGAGASLARRATRLPTLVILDEIHHSGDKKAWGDGLLLAYEGATRRLSLTGTPWRRDNTPIPFVNYDDEGQVRCDFEYTYGRAVVDRVCRPIQFERLTGSASWLDGSTECESSLGPDLHEHDRAITLRTVFDPHMDWLRSAFEAADLSLGEIRRRIPDAGGLVVAMDQTHAKGCANLLARVTGEAPTLVISEDDDAKNKIAQFRNGVKRWMVAVRMVSEGVDIPRLTVGVWASNVMSQLYFEQVIGRFVRVRTGESVTARMFIPHVPELLENAASIEDGLRHALKEEQERRERGEGGEIPIPRVPLAASEALYDGTIHRNELYPPTEVASAREILASLDLPTDKSLDLARVLRERGTAPEAVPPAPSAPVVTKEARMKAKRDAIAKVERRYGREHGDYRHLPNRIAAAGFPYRDDCTEDQLDGILGLLERWGLT